MKKLLLLWVVVLSGCSSLKNPFILESVVIDYSKYSEKGFFISESNSVSFEYIAIGSVLSRSESGFEVVDIAEKDSKGSDGIYRAEKVPNIKYGKYREAYLVEVLDGLYERCISLGADGLIGLKTETIYTVINGKSYVTGFAASGMAIKRK